MKLAPNGLRSDSATDLRSGVPLTNSLTHLRTNGESWLSRGDHLTFRNARAHMPNFPLPDFGGER